MSNSEWGAIRRSLADSVSNVIEKKMGTSSGYKPSEWAEQINLMGALPEKTASGAIANFSDGADDVPVKEAKFYFLPKQASGTPTPSSPISIDGWTGLTAYQFGKNMIDLSSMVDGYVNTNGTFNTNHSNGEMRSDFIPVKPNTTYYFSIIETTGTAADWVGIGEYTSNDVTTFIRRDSFWRFTTSENAKYIVVSSRNLAQATKIQLEVGNDPMTYEAYQAPTTYPVSWSEHGTIYGGYVDATRGKVVKTMKLMTISEMGFVKSVDYFTVNKSTLGALGNSSTSLYCSCFPRGTSANDNVFWETAIGIRFRCSDYSDVTEMEQAIGNETFCFELATPVEYDITAFTPNTLYGTNNFFSDANGDTEVTYRRDIDLALNSGASLLGFGLGNPNVGQESEE